MDEEGWRYEFEQSLEGVADWIVSALHKKIDKYDLVVSGNLRDSIMVETDQDDDENAILTLEFADYGLIQNKGLSGFDVKRNTPFVVSKRASEQTYTVDGGRVGIKHSDIFKWVKARGIKFASTNRGTASIITRSIRRKGYEAKPWLDDVLIDSLPEIDRRIEKALGETAEVAIESLITSVVGEALGRQTFR